jgi:beta-1,4-N-acetylglucosaminyltransferase
MAHKRERSRKVLVTVGTTEFDELLQQLDSANDLWKELEAFNCKHVLIQRGRGTYLFHNFVDQRSEEGVFTTRNGIKVEIFRFHPDLAELIYQVELVISHAGAGTVLEVSSARKLMLVVVNPTLQDNHQEELANAIVSMNSSKCAVARLNDVMTPLRDLIMNNSNSSFVEDGILFPILDSSNFMGIVSDVFNFQKER